jgi:uncharacterized protein
MKPLRLLAIALLSLAVLAGCAALDERQRTWIFQPSDRSWGSSGELANGMDTVWIDFQSKVTGEPVKLHALWLASATANTNTSAKGNKTPVLLYLHGARWNVEGSANRIRRMQELGFSVLAIDYRGFGKSSKVLPSEEMAYEDARAAWDWLAAKHFDAPRYIFGHSLGGAIAIELASQVDDETGTIVEGTFSSIPDVFGSFKWGWLPVKGLITQRFEAAAKVSKIGSPLLVVHGTDAMVMVEGGSHHNTNAVGQPLYRAALAKLFKL